MIIDLNVDPMIIRYKTRMNIQNLRVGSLGDHSDNRVLIVIILSITHWQGLVWLGQGAILYETGPVEQIFSLDGNFELTLVGLAWL